MPSVCKYRCKYAQTCSFRVHEILSYDEADSEPPNSYRDQTHNVTYRVTSVRGLDTFRLIAPGYILSSHHRTQLAEWALEHTALEWGKNVTHETVLCTTACMWACYGTLSAAMPLPASHSALSNDMQIKYNSVETKRVCDKNPKCVCLVTSLVPKSEDRQFDWVAVLQVLLVSALNVNSKPFFDVSQLHVGWLWFDISWGDCFNCLHSNLRTRN